MTMVNVLSPGFLTTIQDLGRYGYAHFGISASGTADTVALRLGNLLVGNSEHAAALEMTLVGGVFEFGSERLISIVGADFEPRLNGEALPLWTSCLVRAGDRLAFGATRSTARCYLCIEGGIECPAVLGSASTHLLTALGGHDGRALKTGDVLKLRTNPSTRRRLYTVLPDVVAAINRSGPLRVTIGPQVDWFSQEAREAFVSLPYRVLENSNRMGLRLFGHELARTLETADRDLLTEGVSLGAVQVPQSGQPIILFVEHQTTGGYPKIANVISADMHRVGQLRPRDEIRFEFVSFEEATRLLQEQERLIGPQSLIPQ
jgi:antagonist of KipI